MKNALQEQLLKAGLATEAQISKANRPKKRPQRKPRRSPKAAPKPALDASGEIDLKAAFEARRAEERREAARKKAEAAQRKKNREKVNRLIQENRLDNRDGDVEYQFMVGSTIKKIWVTAEQRQALLDGKLGVTFLGGQRCLIPVETAQQILELDPKKAISLVDPDAEPEEDEFAVPDDLIW